MTGTAGGEFVRALGHGKLPLLSRSRTTGSTRSARSTTTTVKRPISRLLAPDVGALLQGSHLRVWALPPAGTSGATKIGACTSAVRFEAWERRSEQVLASPGLSGRAGTSHR
jgi:hypothetical protein